MFSSAPLVLVFTIVFAVTGLYSLVRLSALISGAAADGDRLTELFHLLMSIAMVAMTWGWGGSPASAGGALQIVLFSLFGLWFLGRAVWAGVGHALASSGHTVMAVGMVWMVAAMPLLMGMSISTAAGSGGVHTDHRGAMAGMPGMRSADTAIGGTSGEMSGSAAPAWALMVTTAIVVLLVAAAVFWGVHATRSPTAAPSHEASATATGPGGRVATLNAVAVPTGVARLVGRRLDGGCHLLMSLGMAGMLLAML